MEFINAVKDRVVGVVEENVGYMTGNHEMEQRGRELRDTGKDSYNNAANVQNPSDSWSSDQKQDLSAVAKLRDAHHEAISKDDSNSSDNSSSFSLNPSLFSRNQPDPESSAHGAMKDQQHAETIPHWDPVSREVSDIPKIAPINADNSSALPAARDQWTNQSSVPSEDSVGSKWMDKLGSIMSGANNKDEAQTFWRTPELQQEDKDDQRSVMDKLRDAHSDASSTPQQQPSVTNTIKEKFDNWSHSASDMMSGKSSSSTDHGMSENVQEKMGDMKETVQDKMGDLKNQVDSMWNKSGSGSQSVEPLPVKHDATADIPDPNFIQNA